MSRHVHALEAELWARHSARPMAQDAQAVTAREAYDAGRASVGMGESAVARQRTFYHNAGVGGLFERGRQDAGAHDQAPLSGAPNAGMPAGKRAEDASYADVLAKANASSARFRQAQADYRARKIGDQEYLAARRDFEATGKELDRARGESADASIATDPPESEAQRRAMYAAREGRSTLGIPKKVGEEFVGR